MPKNKKKWKPIFFIGVIISIVLYLHSYFYPPRPPAPDIEKYGAGVAADFSSASYQIHKAVDGALSRAGVAVLTINEKNKEAAQQNIEGIVRWHTRNLVVSVPEGTLESAKTVLEKQISSAGGSIIGVRTDQYNARPAIRMDVGIRDTLNGKPITIVTDIIYLTQMPKAGEVKPSKVQGELALIIDDFGYSMDVVEAYIAIKRPLTFSVLPYRAYSKETAAKALAAGYQVMLHLPMEPVSSLEEQEKTTIKVSMGDEEIKKIVVQAINSIPGIVGVNNHQGSKATADKRVMETVLGIIKAHHLFFIDSRTGSQSIAAASARKMAIRTGANDIFIDNSSDVAAIKNQLRLAGKIALNTGRAIAIGHARPNTVIALKEMISELENSGVKLAFVAQFAE